MKKKTYSQFVFFILLVFYSNIYSQNIIEDFFDNTVRKENLPLNNGIFYFNSFKTLNTHQYYLINKYFQGSLIFDNQIYNDVNLKYDIFNDAIIFKPYGESENFGIILIKEKVSQFTINNKKFINLSLTTKESIPKIKGFYEENFKGTQFVFYVKHKKDRRDFIKNQIFYSDFETYNEFLIFIKGEYFEIKGKKDLRILFPDFKNEINTFYSENSKLSKDNKTEFYEKIIRFIDRLTLTK